MNSKQGQECCAVAVTWSTLKILYPADPVCTQSGSLLKLTLLSKSSQSMCKYRLCNLDLKRSLHTKNGAVSSSKKACSFKILNIFQNILSSLCNGQFDFFCNTPKVLSLSLKESPCYLCCWRCLFTGLDSRLWALSNSYSLATAIAFDATGIVRNKLVQIEPHIQAPNMPVI